MTGLTLRPPHLCAALLAASVAAAFPAAGRAQSSAEALQEGAGGLSGQTDPPGAPVDRLASGDRPPGVYRGPAVTPPRAGRPDMPRRRGPGSPSELARALQLRPDQGPALRDYLAATLPTADDRRRGEDAVRRLAAMTTPQRLDFTAQELRRGEADFARRAEAIRRFYGQLTPDQQGRFDRLTAPARRGGAEEGDGVAPPG